MLPQLTDVQKFRHNLYSIFSKRKDAIFNLLDAIASHAHQCDSVVQLSTAPCFDRQYTSITDAIVSGLPAANWKEIEALAYQTFCAETKRHCFVLDCTANPRPYAKTLTDKSIVHTPNPTPGNKPICAGHQYAAIAALPHPAQDAQKHWLVPLSVERVPSDQKGHEFGMGQLGELIQSLSLTNEPCISIADSLYASEKCRSEATKHQNLIHLFRARANRNLYHPPEVTGPTKGRPKVYGHKMTLNDPQTHKAPDEEMLFEQTSARGEKQQVKIKAWYNMRFRGSKSFRSQEHPVTLMQICLYDAKGEALFKRPMFIALAGANRDKVSIKEAYHYYRRRYDIEHFFRFGKGKLLITAYQTPETSNEENWWKLCFLAYQQLYLCRGLASSQPMPWERYLPANKNTQAVQSPSQTQRGFANLLEQLETPAVICLERGAAPGRIAGTKQEKRPRSDIIFKSKKIQIKPLIGVWRKRQKAQNP